MAGLLAAAFLLGYKIFTPNEFRREAEFHASPLPAPLLHAELKDVRRDELFRISEFKGRVVVLEPFATWCNLCTQQQAHISDARTRLDGEAEFVSLDVDPNENEEMVRSYILRYGFDWRFAVDQDFTVVKILEESFGPVILDVTRTFLILIDEKQSVMLRSRPGVKKAKEILELISLVARTKR